MSPSTAPQGAGSYPFGQCELDGDEADLSRVPKPIAQGMAAASVSDSPAKWLGGRGGDGSPVSKPAVVKQRAVIDWVWSYELYPPPIARADYSISPKLFLNV